MRALIAKKTEGDITKGYTYQIYDETKSYYVVYENDLYQFQKVSKKSKVF